MAPSHDQSGQSRQMDTASIQSIVNCFFNLPICDNWSSSQSNLNSNASNETDPGHYLSQPSLSAESGTRLPNNDSHNYSRLATDSARVSNIYSHNSSSLATDSTPVFNNDSHNSSRLATDCTRVSKNYRHNSCSLATDCSGVPNNDSNNSSSLTSDTEEPKQIGSPSHPPCPSHDDDSLH